jgi:hypothetical protein
VTATGTYTCPTCGEKLERDILLFYRHTDRHIVDEILRRNPAWVTADGFCPKCVDYLKREIGHPDPGGRPLRPADSVLVNIGAGGARRRTALGWIGLALAVLGWIALFRSGADRAWRLALFLPLFGASFGFIQARERVCAVLGRRGLRETEGGEAPVEDRALAAALRRASDRILAASAAAAGLVTLGLFFV